MNFVAGQMSGRARASASRTGITAQLPPARLHDPRANTAALRLSFPTTSSSKAAPARQFAANYSNKLTFTHYCACPPASSTLKASRPTSSSSTANRQPKNRGVRAAPAFELWITIRAPSNLRLNETPAKREDLDR